MGETASPKYGLPLDRESMKFEALLKKQSFTLAEFACLLAGIDPASFDGSDESNEVFEAKVGGYLKLLKKEEREKYAVPF